VTPEHHITSKAITVSVTVDEDSNVRTGGECLVCAVSLGGCKHVIALLAWLSRRTEEPAPTEVQVLLEEGKVVICML
jgi:hypothetical protein